MHQDLINHIYKKYEANILHLQNIGPLVGLYCKGHKRFLNDLP